MTVKNPAKTGYSRVYLIEGQARPDHAPEYQSCLKAGAAAQGFGDVTKVECPSDSDYGKFEEVAQIRGAVERATMPLTGLYAADVASEVLRLARKGCAVDVQVHFGACTDPRVFNDFTKSVILENTIITNWSTDDLGALESGEQGKINESADLSSKSVYEVVPIAFAKKADDIVVNEVIDVVICDAISCGDCADESGGCDKIYALTKTAGGSPATFPDVVFSLDGGVVWGAHDVESVTTSAEPSAIFCLGSYVVVTDYGGDAIHYVLKSDLNTYTDPTWTKVATGIVAAGSPNDAWSAGSMTFIVGDAGYVYSCIDPTAGVTVLDAGIATVQNLNAVHALDDSFAVAVGDNGAIVYTTDGVTWIALTNTPAGAGIHFRCVWCKSEKVWFVGTSAGKLYYTVDGGVTWTLKSFSGSGAGVIRDIAFSSDSIGYLAHSTATPAGRILRTYDGGYSWKILPEGSGTIQANDYIGAIATCENDVNMVVGGGLADNATDGILLLGK